MTTRNTIVDACDIIDKHLTAHRHAEADVAFHRVLTSEGPAALRDNEPELRKLLDRFYHKRKRDLTELLERRLTAHDTTAPARSLTSAPEERLPKRQPVEAIMTPTGLPTDPESFRLTVHEEYRRLSLHHIFQWATFYRDFVGRLFEHLFRLVDEAEQAALLSIAFEETARHAAEIFGKGYQYVSQRPGTDALTKSLNGLQGFLSLPIEFYSTLAFNVNSAGDARRLRTACSTLLAGIIEGYGSAAFATQRGWEVLPRFPRSWAHTLAFLTPDAVERVVSKLEEGELRLGLQTTALPVLAAVDRFLAQQSETDFCLPRLGQFVWDVRRLEVSLSLPRVVEQRRYLEIHCYLLPSFSQRGSLEESTNRGANLIAAPLRPDIREWAEAHDILRTTLVDTQSEDTETLVRRGLDVLNHELTKYLGTSRRAEPISFNLAKTFPLQNPFLTRYFLVYRASVRNLLKVFERDTGVRLWCSVRRSGKTTACFDLGASSSNAIVVNQTMEHTEQYADANLFTEAFGSALEAGKQIAPTFVRDAIRACVKDRDAENAKLVFVLDEYETLFERLRLAVARDRELRYAVAQPLLNQMVGFSRENLLIFIGQRPDSHYILMDQNQLSPYVKQDPFPLFEHTKGRTATEFTELVRKVLTERVGFD